MWLNKLFVETSIDFEKRCKTRMIIGILMTVLGLLTIILAGIVDEIFLLDVEQGSFRHGFYVGGGGGLIGAGIATAIINFRYLKNPELKKKRAIEETDERNRMLGLRTWAYAGYSLFLAIYIGILISGFFNVVVMKTLLGMLGVYGLLILLFRIILQKSM